MKRAILVAVCVVTLNVSTRSSGAETTTPSAPAPIALEVLIVEIQHATKAEHTIHLSGPSEEVAARVRELESSGQANVVDRIRMTTLEDQQATVQVGKTAPVASGRTAGGRGGPAQTTYQHQNFGTVISATAKIDGDAILLDITVEKSQLERHTGKASDDAFVPLGKETLTAQGTLRIDSGKTVLVSGLETNADGNSSGQFILASARQLDTSPPAKEIAAAEVKADPNQLQMKDAQQALRRLQREVLDAERTLKEAKTKATAARKAYQSASDSDKADALLRKIEIEAASRKPLEKYKAVYSDFDAAQRAYLELLATE